MVYPNVSIYRNNHFQSCGVNYTELYHQLNSHFLSVSSESDFQESNIACKKAYFISKHISILAKERDIHHVKPGIISLPDDTIKENRYFTYPVFKISGSAQNRRAIILLHGLNERSWRKYLVWAHYLTLSTGRPVILFPIAFHMNRSPEEWGNPRAMSLLLAKRKQHLGDVPMSSFANVALSERLCEDPLRFFTSGQHSSDDLIQLTKQLNKGEHPMFGKGTTVDIFAYSIGGFLAQILFLSNPEGLYSNSKLFLFCGGAMFDRMNGVSKLIMDQEAFGQLRQFYMHELDLEMKRSEILRNSVTQTAMGQSFLAMLTTMNLKTFREEAFRKMHERTHAIALLKDKVIPAAAIMEAINRFSNVEVMDFPYAYWHENPFPVYEGKESKLVDESFIRVFEKAATFLQ